MYTLRPATFLLTFSYYYIKRKRLAQMRKSHAGAFCPLNRLIINMPINDKINWYLNRPESVFNDTIHHNLKFHPSITNSIRITTLYIYCSYISFCQIPVGQIQLFGWNTRRSVGMGLWWLCNCNGFGYTTNCVQMWHCSFSHIRLAVL